MDRALDRISNASVLFGVQPRQPLPHILQLSDPRVSILPQGEEFLAGFYNA